jgi:hypothetical protein
MRANDRTLSVLDTTTGEKFADVIIRNQAKDRFVTIDNVKYRQAKQVIGDKKAIIRVVEKGIEPKTPKYEKAKQDVRQATAALELLKPREKTVYRGVYLEYPEGRAFSLVGLTEKGVKLGMPKISDMPSLANRINPLQNRRNIASYPETAIENELLTSKGALEYQKATAGDIRKIEISNIFNREIRTRKNAFISDKLPTETEAANAAELKIWYDLLRERQEKLVKLYGSGTEQPQLLEEVRRLPGDEEGSFISPEAATEIGKEYVKRTKKISPSVELKEEPHRLIYIRGKKRLN